MLRLRSFPCRLAIIASLVLVGLLLPALHFHPTYEHGHGTDSAHQHGAVHADFLAVFDHGSREHAGDHSASNVTAFEPAWSPDQISLVALASSSLKISFKALQGYSIFVYYDDRITSSRSLFYRAIHKQDHPPPITESYPSLGSPRSPPRSA